MNTVGHKLLSVGRWRRLWQSIAEDKAVLGFSGATLLLFSQFLTILKRFSGWKGTALTLGIRPADLDHQFRFRACGSDCYTIRQVFVAKEHDTLLSLEDVKLIVDCGANIGCAAVRFLSHYPNAHVVAIEPDPENFAVLQANLAPYGSRACALQAAVWNSDDEAMICERGINGDGLDWASTVRPAAEGAGTTRTVSLNRILAQSDVGHIDILKIDIEGAERQLFDAACDSWLSRTRHLCVELHGQECEAIFERTIQRYACKRLEENELVLCSDLKLAQC